MIAEDYVSFEIAELLKEKGFDQYNPDIELFYMSNGDCSAVVGNDIYEIDNYYACPTLQMAMKWLREVHHINISIVYHISLPLNNWHAYISGRASIGNFYKWEDAVKAAIKYSLKNLI